MDKPSLYALKASDKQTLEAPILVGYRGAEISGIIIPNKKFLTID